MIHYASETKTFNLWLDTSFYVFQIDGEGRPVHLGWGLLPEGAGSADSLRGSVYADSYDTHLSFYTQYRPDEVLAFGEITTYQETLKVHFPTAGQQPDASETLHLPVRDLRLRYVDHEIVTDARPGLAPRHEQSTRNEAPRETLRLLLRDPAYPFQVTLCYRLTPEQDVIERWLELENRGDEAVAVESCNFAALHLPNGHQELTTASGAWAREFQIQRERLKPGLRLVESRALQTGHNSNPFFFVNRPGQAWEDNGVVYFGQLAYSGSWRLAFEQLPTGQIRVHGGYNPFDFGLSLAPDERHVTPAFICGVCREGWGGASRRLHAFLQERVLPRSTNWSGLRPVLYNSWEAVQFAINFENQAALAKRAAAIGVELFCVDDGWFGSRVSDTAGLGDWFVREGAFPAGLEPLVDEVERLGMRFGLWVEPEMVNPDSALYRAHPDWVLHFPGRPRTEARSQLILDLGRPEVVEYIYNVLDDLVGRYRVAFFKWDMNRYTAEPGSVAGQEIWLRHVAGVYSIMDRLRRKHPGLEIQSCSGGGGRIDAGMMGRTDQVWVSDNTDAFDRLAIQEGFSLAYPARTMEAWVTDSPNEITQRPAPLALRFDVAMRGALGIGSNLNRLDEEELAEYAEYIRFYKRMRHVIQEGKLYRLQRLEEYGTSTILYVTPGGREAVYSLAIRDFLTGKHLPQAALRGLNPRAFYSVQDWHGHEVYRLKGTELMTLGFPREPKQIATYSLTFYLVQIEEENYV